MREWLMVQKLLICGTWVGYKVVMLKIQLSLLSQKCFT